MKQTKLFSLLCIIFLSATTSSDAQVNLPYTLHFTSNDPTHWSDGIAEPGDGGTQKINGFPLIIYTAGTDHSTLFPGSTMLWWDNNYFYSNDATYTGITSGPDVTVTNNGVYSMVIKTSDQSNFSLRSIKLYDWGYNNVITIESYNNGLKVGAVDFTPSINWIPVVISQSDLLTPSLFNDIDEVRFFPKAPNPVFNLSMNDIALEAAAGATPVTFTSLTATRSNDNIALEWKVENETAIRKYEIQHSPDGREFFAVGNQLPSNNRGGFASYSFLINNVSPGNHFYRIRSLDMDGTPSFSTIVSVSNGKGDPSLTIYPNPAPTGIVSLQMNNLPAGNYYVRLLSNAGRVMFVKTIEHTGGSGVKTLNFSHLKKGIYRIEIIHPDNSKTNNTIIY